MPRRHRLGPGIARHVIQRGNARRPRFSAEIDQIHYLQDLRNHAARESLPTRLIVMTNLDSHSLRPRLPVSVSAFRAATHPASTASRPRVASMGDRAIAQA
jgi:hypothetical protein